MKVHQITCPKCQATLTSKAGIEEGTWVPCPKCKTKFAVRAPEEVAEDFEVVDDEEATPKKKPAPAPAKPAAKRRDDDEDDDEDERPAAKKKGKRDDEDDERPAARKKSRDDDDEDEPAPPKSAARKKARDEDDDEEEAPRSKRKGRDEDDEEESPKAKRGRRDDDDDDDDDRPRRKRRGDDDEDDEPKSGFAKLKSNMWVRIGVLTVLLATAGILGYLLYEKRKKEKDSGANDDNKVVNADDTGGPKDFIVPPKDSRPPKVGLPKKDKGLGNLQELIDGRWAFKSPDGLSIRREYVSNGVYFAHRFQGKTQQDETGTWKYIRTDPGNVLVIEVNVENTKQTQTLMIRFINKDTISHPMPGGSPITMVRD